MKTKTAQMKKQSWAAQSGSEEIQTRNIDDYLSALAEDKRAALEELRATIHKFVPKAEECFSYGLPAFRLNGRPLVAFGATSGHCSFYPMSGSIIAAHAKELREFGTSKGTIRFQPDHPMPVALVRKLVQARIAETTLNHNGKPT